MENIPQRSTKEFLEVRFGKDSSEYPEEITELQKELSEQLAIHNKWCEENGLDPKDNKFFADGFRRKRGSGDTYVFTEKGFISGTYRGKKIYVNPGTEDYNPPYGDQVPVIDIEGEETLKGERIHEEALRIYTKLFPYIMYDMRKIRAANEEIRWNNEQEKRRPEREATEKAHVEFVEKQQEGREAILNVLGIDPARALEILEDVLKSVDNVKLPYDTLQSGLDEAQKTIDVINTLGKRRDELLKALKLDPSKVSLAPSGEIFESAYEVRHVVRPNRTIGPVSWDEYDVKRKELNVSGEVNSVPVSLDLTREYTTENKNKIHADENTRFRIAEEIAQASLKYRCFNKGSLSVEKLHVEIGSGDTENFFGMSDNIPDPNFAREKERRQEEMFSDKLFRVLFTLADYTGMLSKHIVNIEESRRESQRKEEVEKETSARAREERFKKEQDIIKRVNNLFENGKQ